MEIKDDPDRQRKKYNEAWAAYMSSFDAFEVCSAPYQIPYHASNDDADRLGVDCARLPSASRLGSVQAINQDAEFCPPD